MTPPRFAELERAIAMPAAAHDLVLAGVRRLAAYQDVAYAQLYLDRLAPVRAADARADAGGRLVREIARHLAVRMSYEDVIRVAQARGSRASARSWASSLASRSR
jgi:indolepyruvate ferredoxin oxidoreductase, beta subunit